MNVKFKDEFEYTSKETGKEYLVDVEGKVVTDKYDKTHNVITDVVITDVVGNVIDSEDPNYDEIVNEVHEREYEVEIHEADFDHYDNVVGLLKRY